MIRPTKPIIIKRQMDVDRIADMSVKDTRFQTRVLILGTGESTVTVPFPVKFTDRPFVNFGFEFDDSSWPEAQSYPLGTPFVSTWTVEGAIEGAHPGYYIGATIVIRIDGPDTGNFWLHCTFDGKAIRNPLTAIDEIDGPL